MGDMADFYLSQQEGYWGDHDSSDYYSAKAASRGRINYKVCRCCGKDGLHWKQVEGKWLLHNSEGIHKCEKNLYDPKIVKKIV